MPKVSSPHRAQQCAGTLNPVSTTSANPVRMSRHAGSLLELTRGGTRQGRHRHRLDQRHRSGSDDITALVQKTEADLGAVDILVNNAGIQAGH
jgi:NAD(P)-dependent dehydrogenase (short-subunit alcohol dehydrogenase family)